jgi:hypothetical protein
MGIDAMKCVKLKPLKGNFSDHINIPRERKPFVRLANGVKKRLVIFFWLFLSCVIVF